MGTGDGRYVLERARADPQTTWVGVDADAAAMHESSQRAARRLRLDNALFVASDAGRFLRAAAGRVDTLAVHFPWGSLLRGALGTDPGLASALAGALRDGGTLRTVTSSSRRDTRGAAVIEPDVVARAFERHGLVVVTASLATPEDIAATRSTWAKRLQQASDRQTWLFEFRREPPRLV